MKKSLNIAIFSRLGLFIFGIIVSILIFVFVPEDELNSTTEQQQSPPTDTPTPAPVDKTVETSDPVPTETEYEKMSKKAVYVLRPLDLIKAYKTDPEAAHAKYFIKIVRLRGDIRGFKTVSGFRSVLLSNGNMPDYIVCQFFSAEENKLSNYKKGQDVFVVGRVTNKEHESVTLFNSRIASVP